MTLWRGFSRSDDSPYLVGQRIFLRLPQNQDYAEWVDLRRSSHDFLQPWEPSWPKDDLTRHGFRRRLKRYSRDIKDRTAYTFFLFQQNSSQIIGGISLGNIRYGITRSGSLGYWMGEPFARQGYMTEAVRMVCEFAFDNLNLHRVEAACLPTNEFSKKLLLSLDFSWEGQARQYLKINGVWRDHLLFALLASDVD